MRLFNKGLILGVLIALVACESKRTEPAPENVNGSGTVSESKQMSIQLDKQFDKIRLLLVNLNIHYGKLIKVLALAETTNQSSNYTPIDALIDLVDQTQKGIITKTSGKIKKQGKIIIPAIKDGDACQTITTQLDGTVDDTNKSGAYDFSIKGCFNSGAPIVIAHAEYSGEELATFTFDLNALQSAIDSSLVNSINKNILVSSNCQIVSAQNSELPQDVTCKDIKMTHDKDTLTIDELNYLGTGAAVLKVSGRVTGEDKTPKALFKIKFFRDSTLSPEVDFQKVEKQTSVLNPADTASAIDSAADKAPKAQSIQ